MLTRDLRAPSESETQNDVMDNITATQGSFVHFTSGLIIGWGQCKNFQSSLTLSHRLNGHIQYTIDRIYEWNMGAHGMRVLQHQNLTGQLCHIIFLFYSTTIQLNSYLSSAIYVNDQTVVLVCGSLYFVSSIRTYVAVIPQKYSLSFC